MEIGRETDADWIVRPRRSWEGMVLRRGALFFALGAITSLLVAWVCVFRGRMNPIPVRAEEDRASWTLFEKSGPTHARYELVWSHWGAGRSWTAPGEEFVATYLPIWARVPERGEKGAPLEYRFESAGWPLMAFGGLAMKGDPHGLVLDSGGHDAPARTLSWMIPAPATDMGVERFLPWRPIWPGFVLDSLLFGEAWAVVVLAARRFMPSRRRARAGLCARCGHDRRGEMERDLGAACSACGWRESAPAAVDVRRWGRGAATVAACFVGGGVIAVGVAAAGAMWGSTSKTVVSPTEQPWGWQLRRFDGPLTHAGVLEVYRIVSQRSRGTELEERMPEPPNLDALRVLGWARVPEYDGWISVKIVSAGWPRACLTSTRVWRIPMKGVRSEKEMFAPGVLIDSDSDIWVEGNFRRILPLTPVWPGLLIDAGVYGAGLLLGVVIVRGARTAPIQAV